MPNRPPRHQAPFQPTRTPDQERGTAHQRGYDRRWAKIRLFHLQQNPLCFSCENYATLVDHIVPVAVAPGRRLDPTNLRSCCTDCHAKITTNFKTTGRNELPKPSLAFGGWA